MPNRTLPPHHTLDTSRKAAQDEESWLVDIGAVLLLLGANVLLWLYSPPVALPDAAHLLP